MKQGTNIPSVGTGGIVYNTANITSNKENVSIELELRRNLSGRSTVFNHMEGENGAKVI